MPLRVSPTQRTPPQDCGRRLLPVVIDKTAREDPERTWASLPYDDDDLSKGYEDINYGRLADAINKLSWLIVLAIGTSSTFETIAYYGAPDVRYSMMAMAACKTGHKVLFATRNNTEDNHIALMEHLQCKAVFSASAVDVNHLVERWPVPHIAIPELDDLLNDSGGTELFPYTKTFKEAQLDPYFVLHTSGTTGMPKPVIFTHAMAAAWDAHALLPDVEGRPHQLDWISTGPAARIFLPTPPYYSISARLFLHASVFGGSIIVPGFRHRAAEANDLCNIIEHSKVNLGIMTPWFLEDIARRPGSERYMKCFDRILYGGATLSSLAAQKWAQHTHLQTFWAMTETATPPTLQSERDEYEYVVFDMVHSGLEFRPIESLSQDAGGNPVVLYQAILKLTPESESTATWSKGEGLTLRPGPPYPEFDTRDLWTPHPDPKKAHYVWKFAGRADDMITFTTGSNLHRAEIERDFVANEMVSAALIVGSGHRQAVLLLELADGVSQEETERLWEAVVAPENERVPSQGYVCKTHVITVACGEFIRTTNGSIARRATEEKYAKEIEAVYDMHGDDDKYQRKPIGSVG